MQVDRERNFAVNRGLTVDGGGRGGRTVDQKSRGDPWVMRGSCVPHHG